MRSNAYPPESDETAAGRSNIATRQAECMCAFQTERSWYQAYWYPEPRPRAVSSVPTLIAVLSVVVASLLTTAKC
jgi:hypothetical protein